ncbi:MAG: hypothetical protein CSA62_01975 [Planctomycetota bacterium]|nr:MAG: hypothetical protein CSA62_01975 [Planctomycetota bacterium]
MKGEPASSQGSVGTATEPSGIWAIIRDNPQWRKLFLARTTSLLGDWLNALAIVYLLGEGSSSAIAIAIVFVLKQVPIFLLGPAAGVFADRYDRKKIMVGCNLLAAALVLGFLLYEFTESSLLLYVLVALQLSVTTFFEPARQSVFPSVVPKRDLVVANVISSASWSIMFTFGSFAGGVLLALLGWQAAIVIDAITYLISASILWTVKLPPREATVAEESPEAGSEPRGLKRLLGIDDMISGLRYILSTREVFSVILVKFGWGTMGVVTLLLTLLGRSEPYQLGGRPELGISFLWGCRGLGTLFGPFLAQGWAGSAPERLKQTLTISYFAAPLCYFAIYFFYGHWLITGLLVFAAHLAGSTIWVISTVLLQQVVPETYRGRCFAAELGLVMFSSALSQILYAILMDSEILSLRGCFIAAPMLCLLPALLWLRNRRKEQQELRASAGF